MLQAPDSNRRRKTRLRLMTRDAYESPVVNGPMMNDSRYVDRAQWSTTPARYKYYSSLKFENPDWKGRQKGIESALLRLD